jgi:hypothetical protein
MKPFSTKVRDGERIVSTRNCNCNLTVITNINIIRCLLLPRFTWFWVQQENSTISLLIIKRLAKTTNLKAQQPEIRIVLKAKYCTLQTADNGFHIKDSKMITLNSQEGQAKLSNVLCLYYEAAGNSKIQLSSFAGNKTTPNEKANN